MVPPATLLIEGPAAVVDTSVATGMGIGSWPRRSWRTSDRPRASGSWRTTASDRSTRRRRRPAPVPPGCSRWPTWAVGTKNKKEVYGPAGSGLRSSSTGTKAGGERCPGPFDRRRHGGPGCPRGDPRLSRRDGRPAAGGVLAFQVARPGASAFWTALADPFAWHALKLTFVTAR